MSSAVAPPSVNPWEARDDRGAIRAFFETVWSAVRRPRRLFASTHPEAGLGAPLLYGTSVLTAGFVIEAGVIALVHLLWPDLLPTELAGRATVSLDAAELSRVPGWLISALGCQAAFLLLPIIVVLYTLVLLLWAGIVHLGVLSAGGRRRPGVGFVGTMGAVGYAGTASLAQIIPFVGDLVFVVGSIALCAIGLEEIHGAGRGRAVLAAALPVLVILAVALIVAGLRVAGG